MFRKFWCWLFDLAVKKIPWETIDNMDGLTRRSIENDKWRISVIYRERNTPLRYTREELVKMLRTIREHEKRMDWKVPE